jgi:hypothetical protein
VDRAGSKSWPALFAVDGVRPGQVQTCRRKRFPSVYRSMCDRQSSSQSFVSSQVLFALFALSSRAVLIAVSPCCFVGFFVLRILRDSPIRPGQVNQSLTPHSLIQQLRELQRRCVKSISASAPARPISLPEGPLARTPTDVCADPRARQQNRVRGPATTRKRNPVPSTNTSTSTHAGTHSLSRADVGGLRDCVGCPTNKHPHKATRAGGE